MMRNRPEVMGTRQKWMWIVTILAVLLMTGAVPGYARVRVFRHASPHGLCATRPTGACPASFYIVLLVLL